MGGAKDWYEIGIHEAKFIEVKPYLSHLIVALFQV